MADTNPTDLYDRLWPDVMRAAMQDMTLAHADDVLALLAKLEQNPTLAAEMQNPRERTRIMLAYVLARVSMAFLFGTARTEPTQSDALRVLHDFMGGMTVVVMQPPTQQAADAFQSILDRAKKGPLN